MNMEAVASWEGSGGALQIARVGQSVAHVAMTGIVEASAGSLLEQALQSLFEAGAVHSFWDMLRLKKYHSEIRIRATAVLAKNRTRILSIQVCADSRLVDMGVAIANLSLGGMIKIHRTPEAFEAALREATQGAR